MSIVLTAENIKDINYPIHVKLQAVEPVSVPGVKCLPGVYVFM